MRSSTIPKTGFGLSAAAAGAGTAPTPGTGSVFSYCDFDTSWLTQVKVTGSYTLPWQEIQIGGVLQNLPGQQIIAQWNITQADADRTLGRAAVGRRQHVARRAAHQAGDDVHAAPDAGGPARLEELQAVGGAAAAGDGRHLQRVQLQRGGRRDVERRRAAGGDQHDLFADDPTWLKPLNILQARYVKFGAQFTF